MLLTEGQIAAATEILGAWWARATVVSAPEIAHYAALPRMPKVSGGDVGKMLEVPQVAALEAILAEGPMTAGSRRYWINSNYHDPENEFWWRRGWVSDGKRKTYEIGDLLVVYLGKTNGGPQRCPAILRVEAPCEEDREFVLRERDFEAAKKWPFVTRTSVVTESPPWAGARLAVAGKTPVQVENGCKLTRKEFEQLALAMPG